MGHTQKNTTKVIEPINKAAGGLARLRVVLVERRRKNTKREYNYDVLGTPQVEVNLSLIHILRNQREVKQITITRQALIG